MSLADIYKVSASPLMAYACLPFRNSHPVNLNTIYADIRRMAPYYLYVLIYEPVLFAYERYNYSMNEKLPEVRKLAKKAEKLFLKHLATRAKAQQFLNALVLPEKKYPHWFVSLYQEIHETEEYPPSPLKNDMDKLSSLDYQKVKQHISYYHTKWAVSPFTQAMLKLENIRDSASTRVIGQVNNIAKDLFLEMFTFLLDIYVIVHLLNHPPKRNEIVVMLTGAQHTDNLTRFLAPDSEVVSSKFDAKGNIPEGEAIQGFGEIPPLIKDKLRNLLASHFFLG
jgi:hypothetical protein